jgi:hypothetical protein
MEIVQDKGCMTRVWTTIKYENQDAFEKGEAFETIVNKGNVLLNEGITAMWNLIGGLTATAFSNANAYLGVGDSATAATASQTGLQASTNKAYVAMSATYPQVSNQTITFQGIFDGSTGNFAWNEMTVASGNSDSAVNMNRKVSSQGTKISGQVWTLTLAITLS